MRTLYELWMRYCIEKMDYWNSHAASLWKLSDLVRAEGRYRVWSDRYSKALGRVGL